MNPRITQFTKIRECFGISRSHVLDEQVKCSDVRVVQRDSSFRECTRSVLCLHWTVSRCGWSRVGVVFPLRARRLKVGFFTLARMLATSLAADVGVNTRTVTCLGRHRWALWTDGTRVLRCASTCTSSLVSTGAGWSRSGPLQSPRYGVSAVRAYNYLFWTWALPSESPLSMVATRHGAPGIHADASVAAAESVGISVLFRRRSDTARRTSARSRSPEA